MGHIKACMSQSSKSVSTIRCCQCARPSQQRWHLAAACPKGIVHRTLSRRQRSDPPALRKSHLRALSLRWYALFSHIGASSVTNDQHPHRILSFFINECSVCHDRFSEHRYLLNMLNRSRYATPKAAWRLCLPSGKFLPFSNRPHIGHTGSNGMKPCSHSPAKEVDVTSRRLSSQHRAILQARV